MESATKRNITTISSITVMQNL